MNYTNGYQQYKEQSIATMTKGEMLNLLYEEMIKRLNRAKLGLEHEDYAIFEKEVSRVKEILAYLNSTLNRKYAISNELARLYDFINYELSRLNASRNSSIIDEIIPFVAELRDTFKEADRLAKKGNGMTSIGG